MSPRAACRLDALGFADVYDYTAGKAEWLAYGLPTEGERANRPRAGRLVRTDVVGCLADEKVGRVRRRVDASPFGFALVVSSSGVVLGRLGRSVLKGDPDALAGAVMDSGPSTVRPDVDPATLARRLRERGIETAIVTTPDGRLVGIVRADDLAAGESSRGH
jgi:Mg/Co/Ni transporter MgtE